VPGRAGAVSACGAAQAPVAEITATPCRHGPPLSRPLAGDVIGFGLRWDGQEHGALWISGWNHFQESRDTIQRVFATAPDEVRRAVRWLPLGGAVELAA
jgi:hypothetical protein